MLVFPFNLAYAQSTQVSSTVNLNWFSLQVTYPAEVEPGDTVPVSVLVVPKNSSLYLLSLTVSVYYADTTGLHLIATQTLAGIPATASYGLPVWGPYGTESFSTNFTVTVPPNASRTSLVAVFSETVQSNYYAMYNLFWPQCYYFPDSLCRYRSLQSYYESLATDNSIAGLSYIEATTPEYVSLQTAYRSLQQQLNQTQTRNQQLQTTITQLQTTITQQSVMIRQLNQQLTTANTTAQTYEAVAVVFVIIAVALAAFSIYQLRSKRKLATQPSDSAATAT
jgi:hypothetical protein